MHRWDPKPTDDEFDELDCGLLVDFDHGGHFRPLGEFVDDDVEIPVPSDDPGKRSQDVQPPHNELSWGWDHLQRLHRCVDLLGMKLASLASLYQLNSILYGYRPVKATLEGFTDQHVGRCMVAALTSMNLSEQLATLLLGYAPH
jgi:hypothetical protein